jgi:hypothetical protein
MPAKRTIDELISEIKLKGWKLSNLFELETGMWQANVRRIVDTHTGAYTYFHEFCVGATPNEAVEGCLIDMAQDRNKTRPVPPGAALEYVKTGGRSDRSRELDLEKLIEDSGL